MPESAGYESYSIKLTDIFSSLSMTVTTPKGDISYSVSENGNVRTISVTAISAEGSIYIPASWGSVSSSDSDCEITAEDGYTVVKTSGGNFTLTVSS